MPNLIKRIVLAAKKKEAFHMRVLLRQNCKAIVLLNIIAHTHFMCLWYQLLIFRWIHGSLGKLTHLNEVAESEFKTWTLDF